jgi:hypothetical protein
MVDARKYALKFIKPDNVREESIQTRILAVFESERYGNLVLELENGSQFNLYEGNNSILIKAWGPETDGWIGKELILELGTYKDWRANPPEDKETVRVRAVLSGNGSTPAASKPLPPSRLTTSEEDLNDMIPF